MSRQVLSQAEMNALLPHGIRRDSTRRSHRDDSDSVVPYNFRRRDRVSREQMHSLLFLHERFARNIATSLSAYLRTVVELSVVAAEQGSYAEFLTTVSDPTAFYALSISPFPEVGALEITPPVAFAMIDRMLGGGDSLLVGSEHAAPLNRALTEIEQNVVDSVVELMLAGLTEVWKPIVDLTFGVRARETRPQMLRVSAPNEIVVMLIFDLKVGDARSTISLCIPSDIIEQVGAQFAHAWQHQRRELTEEEQSWMMTNLGTMLVPLVPLIRTRLSANDVLALKEGDVLSLALAAEHAIDLQVGGISKLKGRLAVAGGRLKVQIESRCATDAMSLAGAA